MLRRTTRFYDIAAVMALACAGLTLSAPPARADGIIHSASIGVLAHDVPDLWSGFQIEPDAADINIEIKFTPSMPLLGGTDAHGDVSVYFEHTSNAYTQDYTEGLDRIGVRYGYRF